ncbi:MAG: hypothetical protein VX438_18990, partial [Planctomycetota bacterium]|nr:hypothetical protein [Planctomycetota bacterium]
VLLFLVSFIDLPTAAAQISGAPSQEPPKFRKPIKFGDIRNADHAQRLGRQNRVPANPVRMPIQQSRTYGSGILQGVQYQQPGFGSKAVGSGVRRTVQTQAIQESVNPIDDPFGDRLPGESAQFSAEENLAIRPPKIHQESILRRPANGTDAERSVEDNGFQIQPIGSGSIADEAPGINVPDAGFRSDFGAEVSPQEPAPVDPEINPPTVEPSPLPKARQEEFRQQVFELNCDEINGVMLQKSIQNIALNLKPDVEQGKVVPSFCTFEGAAVSRRDWQPQSFVWTASAACSKPLYFQHIQLERYGHSRGPLLQPILSAAHFLGNAAIYPYKAGIHPPDECMSVLGYYRPGDAAPWLREPWPWSVRGAMNQALSTAQYGVAFR